MDEDDSELENLSKDEQRALLLAPWTVERHDHDDGMIAYEIWCHNPYWRICSIFDNDNQYAKKCADKIVADHLPLHELRLHMAHSNRGQPSPLPSRTEPQGMNRA